MDQLDQRRTIYGTFNLDEVIAEFPPDPDSAARHRAEILVKTDTLRVVLVTILAGGRLHEHAAPGPITIHVLHGAITLTVEGEPRVLGAGEMIALAPNVEHGVEGVEDGAFLLTIAHLSRIPDEGGDDV